MVVEQHPILKDGFAVPHVGSFLVAPATALAGLIGIPVSAWKNRHGRTAPDAGC